MPAAAIFVVLSLPDGKGAVSCVEEEEKDEESDAGDDDNEDDDDKDDGDDDGNEDKIIMRAPGEN